jgi:hypothetical protein
MEREQLVQHSGGDLLGSYVFLDDVEKEELVRKITQERLGQDLELIVLDRTLKQSAENMGRDEARMLVNAYYIQQDNRKRAFNQLRAMEQKPHTILQWFADNAHIQEKQIRSVLDVWTNHHPIGKRIRKVKGIGPVIAAGLLAHIDIHIATTVGKIWRFAGLDCTVKWEKGQKRPWNADLKRLCFLIGDCFCKVSGYPDAVYGHMYKQKKAEYTAKNESGGYAERAAQLLLEKKWDKTKAPYKAYMQGKLPLGQIDQMAKRWTTKMFLSHMHQVWFEHEFNRPAPVPYVIAHLNHVDFIPPAF